MFRGRGSSNLYKSQKEVIEITHQTLIKFLKPKNDRVRKSYDGREICKILKQN